MLSHRISPCLLSLSLMLGACGSDSTSDGETGGSAGSSAGGKAGSAGKTGQAGVAGSAGQGGAAGSSAGTGGTGGQSGAGQSGAGQGGVAGSSGVGGAGQGGAGAAGEAGASGGGNAGSGGKGESCASGVLCGAQGVCCAAGEECAAGACLPACTSGVLCAGVCCAAGELCVEQINSSVCAPTTGDCLDVFDCAPGERCEVSVGKCVAEGAASKCTLDAQIKEISPQLVWSFSKPVNQPTFDQAISAPLVADFDHDQIPEVVVTTADINVVSGKVGGYLRMLDGKTGQERWDGSAAVFLPENQVETNHSPAIADLDGDGKLEIVAVGHAGDIIVFSDQGAVKFRSTKPGGAAFSFIPNNIPGTVAVADMDGDGLGEIVFGGVVLDHQAVYVSGEDRVNRARYGNSHLTGPSSVIADVDQDGVQDVVLGNAAYARTGALIWERQDLSDGYPAIADLDLDGAPEIAVTSTGSLRILSAQTGADVASVPIPQDGTFPGSPTIADVDGDGAIDIAVQHGYAPSCWLSAFRFTKGAGLSVLWSKQLLKCSGALTATAFDFNGDGAVEIVAHDDCYVWLVNGKDGATLTRLPASHASWTEFVSVADVDGDDSADLLFSSNDSYNGAPYDWTSYCGYGPDEKSDRGVRVFRDPDRAWMPTRRIWNQQAYHITNVKADGSLPKPEPASWGPKGFNNYRVSAQGKTAKNAPDLVVSLSADLNSCADKLVLKAKVTNQGSAGVKAGVPVSFYEEPGAVLLGTKQTAKALAPGQSEELSLELTGDTSTQKDYSVKVNEDGSSKECQAGNNASSLTQVTCEKKP